MSRLIERKATNNCDCGCSMVDFLCYDCINESCPMRAKVEDERRTLSGGKK